MTNDKVVLKISQTVWNEMINHASETYPEECCGAISGSAEVKLKIVTSSLRFRNSSTKRRERRFLIVPEDYKVAEKTATELDLTLLGFYHSHPNTMAVPSDFDLEHALPWFSYPIISIDQNGKVQVRSYRISDDRLKYIEEAVII